MARVIVDTWFAAHERQVSAETLHKRRNEWGYAESEQAWQRSIRESDGVASRVLVACDGDDVVAVAYCSLSAPDRVEVGALYVRQTRQRTGVGRMLLDDIIEFYRAIGVPWLDIAVLRGNQPARRFYESLGGTLSGSRLHEDGPQVVYTWELTPS
jgi:GNAT superfamily N-acetyltransferase